ncbi:hypothetical protein WUBG_05546 [Wuchereria bancrofti]|uniref:Uncharacterized protein n=1 Tax=Wuchereria bancrofti TaxID=6293 RepID=J9B918_WUCBA|nr:hypothetical protein WUBG_05546 [Wuchereria bancrofti]VDM20544.1 unnamed protein product [Wuchereria bancrofti]
MLRDRLITKTARSFRCCFICTQEMSLRRKGIKHKKVKEPKAAVSHVSSTNAIKNVEVTPKEIETQKNEDYLPIMENEHQRREQNILDNFQSDKNRRHKLMHLDLLFREKNYFRKLDFPRIEQCAAWLNSERYHWGGWHIRIPTSRPRFGIVLAIGHCWWRKTSFKCAHELAILVVRTSFSIIYEKHYHNHAIFRKPLVSFKDYNYENNQHVEFLRTHLPPVETLLSH